MDDLSIMSFVDPAYDITSGFYDGGCIGYNITESFIDGCEGGIGGIGGGIGGIGGGIGGISGGGVDVKKYTRELDSKKDETLANLLPDNIGECFARDNNVGHCMSEDTLKKIADNVDAAGDSPSEIIEKAKQHTECSTERCVVEKMSNVLGNQLVHSELKTNFKIPGPTDTTLLSNFDTDAIMLQLEKKHPKFHAYNFNMANFREYSFRNGTVVHSPDTLHTVPFRTLYSRGVKCAGCIINTDRYQGGGKHWMAIFIDARTPNVTVELFNSSGGPSSTDWASWVGILEQTRSDMDGIKVVASVDAASAVTAAGAADAAATVTTAKVTLCTKIRHQQSMTECGLYSLFYIYARLSGVPASYFCDAPIPDQHMFEFRQHLFADQSGSNIGVSVDGKFSWDEFNEKVRVKWE
tara:strand:- start:18294 stop:19520 length:1227 start_codon:yes stop_codon:yes gene_type:complete